MIISKTKKSLWYKWPPDNTLYFSQHKSASKSFMLWRSRQYRLTWINMFLNCICRHQGCIPSLKCRFFRKKDNMKIRSQHSLSPTLPRYFVGGIGCRQGGKAPATLSYLNSRDQASIKTQSDTDKFPLSAQVKV